MRCGHRWVIKLINNGFGLKSTPQPEKLLGYILVIALVSQQNNYGNRYHLSIDNVQFITLIFGRLMNRFYLVNDTKQWVKKVVKRATLKDLITPCDNELDD
jgi:hypothetical protein